MVLLTVTPLIAEGLQLVDLSAELLPSDGEPSLKDATVGNPILHGQIVELWTLLRTKGHNDFTLEGLLRGSKVYVPPPPPKPEPVRQDYVSVTRTSHH